MTFVELSGEKVDSAVEEGSLIFSLCQTLIVYRTSSSTAEMAIDFRDGTRLVRSGSQLSAEESRELFNRTGKIRRIDVSLPRSV
jgi:hypothetical protein